MRTQKGTQKAKRPRWRGIVDAVERGRATKVIWCVQVGGQFHPVATRRPVVGDTLVRVLARRSPKAQEWCIDGVQAGPFERAWLSDATLWRIREDERDREATSRWLTWLRRFARRTAEVRRNEGGEHVGSDDQPSAAVSPA